MTRARKQSKGAKTSESVRRLAEAIAVVCPTTQSLHECLVEATRMLDDGRRPDGLDWPDQQDARDKLAAKLSKPDHPVSIGGKWIGLLIEIDTLLTCWWTALENALDLLNRVGSLVDDPRAAPIDRWTTNMRRQLRELRASLDYTNPGVVRGCRVRMLILNLQRGGVPQGWLQIWRSLSSETGRLFAIHAEAQIGGHRPLTGRQQELWNALAGRVMTARQLADDKELISSGDAVTHLVAAIRERGHRIENIPGQGYYRPDAPPPGLDAS